MKRNERQHLKEVKLRLAVAFGSRYPYGLSNLAEVHVRRISGRRGYRTYTCCLCSREMIADQWNDHVLAHYAQVETSLPMIESLLALGVERAEAVETIIGFRPGTSTARVFWNSGASSAHQAGELWDRYWKGERL